MSETKPAFHKNSPAEFTSAFAVDRRLFAADVFVNLAYADALFDAGILTRQETERVKNGLQTILKRADYDRNYFAQTAADNVHSFIESRLVQLVGESGAKLAVGRNRRQQTETDLRVWLRGKITGISKQIRSLQEEILRLAENYKEASFYTNQNRIFWAEWCLDYLSVWEADRERLDEVWRRVNVFPLPVNAFDDAAAEIDFEDFARKLRFEGVTEIYSEAAFRFDFVVEFVNASSFAMFHSAALAEDLSEFADLFKTGENLNSLRAVNAKAGKVLGRQTALTSILGSFRFNRSVQEILEAVFDTFDTTDAVLTLILDSLRNLSLPETAESDLSEKERERIENALENARNEWRFEE